jgi:hypothetical protein
LGVAADRVKGAPALEVRGPGNGFFCGGHIEDPRNGFFFFA